MKNIKELRDELIAAFTDLQKGELKAKEAKEVANMAGKIIGSIKLEIDYAKLNDRKKEIDFLNYE